MSGASRSLSIQRRQFSMKNGLRILQFWGNPMDHRLGFEDVEECRLVDNGEPLANVLEEIGPGFDIDGGLIGHREGDGRRSEVATELVGGP